MAPLHQKEGIVVVSPTQKRSPVVESCQIIAVGKRRDGGTRFWCLGHGADATAKYGRRASSCRYSHVPRVEPNETISLDLRKYPGGVGVWGAVPPVFDTTRLGLDRGIHIHARADARAMKQIDDTYRRVHITDGDVRVDINELDAIYFMVSTVFEKKVDEVVCTYCRSSHLDKDWFSVHPHRRHLCAACGKHFRDDKVAVGNPAARAAAIGGKRPEVVQAKSVLKIRQKDFPGGIRVWGSNAAVVWTSKKPELAGIHVHAYENETGAPTIDETFARVTIDDVALDAGAVRTYMAQMAMPHLAGRIVVASCAKCGVLAFDRDEAAFSPCMLRRCAECDGPLETKSRLRKVVANPLVEAISLLERHAVRRPQKHDLGLLPESI